LNILGLGRTFLAVPSQKGPTHEKNRFKPVILNQLSNRLGSGALVQFTLGKPRSKSAVDRRVAASLTARLAKSSVKPHFTPAFHQTSADVWCPVSAPLNTPELALQFRSSEPTWKETQKND